jgi:NTE family protein
MEGTGLVLAGGGGKGIYQVGMIKSLAAAGLLDDVVAVSGTSIGGVNAVLFAEGLLEGKFEFDNSISDKNVINGETPQIDEKIRTAAGIQHAVQQMEDVWNEIDFGVFFDFDADKLSAGDNHFSRKATEELISKYLDYSLFHSQSKISAENSSEMPAESYSELSAESASEIPEDSNSVITTGSVISMTTEQSLGNVSNESIPEINKEKIIPTFVAAAACPPGVVTTDHITEEELRLLYSGSVEDTYRNYSVEYICLPEKENDYIRNAILATTALPVIYNPVRIGDKLYVDGGVKDNVPIKPLYDLGIRRFIVIELSTKSDIKNPEQFADAEIIDILPSHELGRLVSGTMNFDWEDKETKKEIGVRDGKRYIKTLFEKDEAYIAVERELALRDYNDIIAQRDFKRHYNRLEEDISSRFDYIKNIEDKYKF